MQHCRSVLLSLEHPWCKSVSRINLLLFVYRECSHVHPLSLRPCRVHVVIQFLEGTNAKKEKEKPTSFLARLIIDRHIFECYLRVISLIALTLHRNYVLIFDTTHYFINLMSQDYF